jgi:hypothetical protein
MGHLNKARGNSNLKWSGDTLKELQEVLKRYYFLK